MFIEQFMVSEQKSLESTRSDRVEGVLGRVFEDKFLIRSCNKDRPAIKINFQSKKVSNGSRLVTVHSVYSIRMSQKPEFRSVLAIGLKNPNVQII